MKKLTIFTLILCLTVSVAIASESLDAYFDTGDDATYSGGYGTTDNIYAQTFTVVTSGDFPYIDLLGTRCTSGDYTVTIRTTTAGVIDGNSGILATASGACTSLSATSPDWHRFTFSSPVALTSGVVYGVTIITTANSFGWRGDSTAPSYTGGQLCYDNSVPRDGNPFTACLSTDDLMFRLYRTDTVSYTPLDYNILYGEWYDAVIATST